MKFYVIEKVDPEGRRLRLKKISDYGKRHTDYAKQSMGGGSRDRKMARVHLDRATTAHMLVKKFSNQKRPKKPGGGTSVADPYHFHLRLNSAGRTWRKTMKPKG